jgi:hypothetical protein
MDIEKVRTGSYALVLEQISRHIAKLEKKQIQNVVDIKVKNLSDSYAGGLLTTMEFLNQVQDVIDRHPEEYKALELENSLLLTLYNAQHIILKIS